MNALKTYLAECSGSNEHASIPAVAAFEIDAAKAAEILKLAAVVTAHNLHKVEKFDYSPRWLKTDPSDPDQDDCLAEDREDGEPTDDEDSDPEMRTECDCLNVSSDSFWFSCLIKHTDVEVTCANQPIRELAVHFGLEPSTGALIPKDATR